MFCCQVAHHVTPLQACESRLALRLVSEHEPRVCVFAVLQVLLEHVVLLNRHLFVADRAHVVIIAVVDVCFVLVVEAGLEGLPGGLRRVFRRNILGAFGLVKDAGGALDSKMLTKRVEPLEYRAISGERSETDLFEWLLEAEDAQGMLLRQDLLPAML